MWRDVQLASVTSKGGIRNAIAIVSQVSPRREMYVVQHGCTDPCLSTRAAALTEMTAAAARINEVMATIVDYVKVCRVA